MRESILLAALVALALQSPLLAQTPAVPLSEDQCIVCHVDLELIPDDYAPYDVHMQPGLSCAGCHGGDPTSDDMEISMSEEAGFVGVPSAGEIPQFCGKCHSQSEIMRRYQPGIHTDQVEQYYTSQHGQKLLEGDPRVATCTSCHGSHHILGALDARSAVHPLNVPETCDNCHGSETRMRPYGLPTDQFEKYAQSIHGVKLLEERDLAAPVCNDCHGNHGALPPQVESVDEVCGSCHANNLEYFRESTMAAEFAALDFHGCGECHGYHAVADATDAMLGVGEGSVCLECHSQGEEGYAVAGRLYEMVTGLVAAYDTAAALREVVQRIGKDDVEIGYLLQDATQALVHSRTLIHTFDVDRLGTMTGEGMRAAEAALSLANSQIYAERNRRIGFGIATLFTTLLAIGLYLRIREIDKETFGE